MLGKSLPSVFISNHAGKYRRFSGTLPVVFALRYGPEGPREVYTFSNASTHLYKRVCPSIWYVDSSRLFFITENVEKMSDLPFAEL